MQVCTQYKIKDNKTGLYSTGTSNPQFSERGKIFDTVENLRNHIRAVHSLVPLYRNCSIVEVQVTYVESSEIDILSIIEDVTLTYKHTSPRVEKNLRNLVCNFVQYGECSTAEFEKFIREYTHPVIIEYVPYVMCVNFENYIRKGLNSCSDSELAEVILSATQEQLKIYKL